MGAPVDMIEKPAIPVHVAATTPYPWPWNGDLDAAGTAVLVVDSELGTPEASAAETAAMSTVVAAVRAAGGTVIRVNTVPPRRLPRVSSVHPAEHLDGADVVIDAAGLDGFFGSGLESILRSRRIERLLLVGTAIETAIHSTMRSANDRGFECLLVVDACVPLDPELIASSVSMIEMSGGIFGAVGTSVAVAEALGWTKGRTS
jgi:nicotinamidase-related amidase